MYESCPVETMIPSYCRLIGRPTLFLRCQREAGGRGTDDKMGHDIVGGDGVNTVKSSGKGAVEHGVQGFAQCMEGIGTVVQSLREAGACSNDFIADAAFAGQKSLKGFKTEAHGFRGAALREANSL